MTVLLRCIAAFVILLTGLSAGLLISLVGLMQAFPNVRAAHEFAEAEGQLAA